MTVRELAETQAALPPDAPLEVRARALADQWMDRLARERESVVLHMEFIAHAGRDPELARRFGSRSAAMREAVSRYISAYQEEAGVEPPLSADELALLLRALGIGLAVESLDRRPSRIGLCRGGVPDDRRRDRHPRLVSRASARRTPRRGAPGGLCSAPSTAFGLQGTGASSRTRAARRSRGHRAALAGLRVPRRSRAERNRGGRPQPRGGRRSARTAVGGRASHGGRRAPSLIE